MPKRRGITTIEEAQVSLGQLKDDIIANDKFKQQQDKDLDMVKSEIGKKQTELNDLSKQISNKKIELEAIQAKFMLDMKTKEDKLIEETNKVSELKSQSDVSVKGLSDKQKEIDDKSNVFLNTVKQYEEKESKLALERQAFELEKEELLKEKLRIEQDKQHSNSLYLETQEKLEDVESKNSFIEEKEIQLEKSVSSLEQKRQEVVIKIQELDKKIELQNKGMIELDNLTSKLQDKEKMLNAKEKEFINKEKQIKDEETRIKAEDKELKIREGLVHEAERMDILSKRGVKL